ncbi:putative bifunctional diguanylate cyclase/phosphodiesterase [Paractinoplanes lichenicola]|uniref:Bifunctional diguanylate cyclase/phosphodiesterase n=1 Tax=Paractinoplanes lichenicola TaxID=2802976 RepID=A0ABS1W4W1_9ACTN|nr:bifunctional diguanylate cyclase/phosphodiesterase [Actinoplanes lichenicola]MBL7261770.1 bifunctional diguanylate cyclase/phosphodiesterase [Actinoplanes lichenicola]
MTGPVGPAARRAGTGLAPLLIAAAATMTVAVWLMVRDPQAVVLGYVWGPVAMIGAAWSLQRIGAMVMLPRVMRAFWRQLGHAAVILLISSSTALALANNNAGMSLYVAVPMLTGMFWTMTAFLRLPVTDRAPLSWLRVLLDGATVAVAAGIVFWYVVLSSAPPGTDLATRAVAGTVGVAGVLCLVVIGKAGGRADGPIDPVALRLLTAAPIVAVTLAVLLIAGNDFARLTISVGGSPLVALSFAAAAYRQRRVLGRPAAEAAPRPFRRTRTEAVPFLAVGATAVLVTYVSVHEMTSRQRTLIFASVVIAVLVAARVLLGLRDNNRMLAGLREQQAELQRLALTDPLTELANRTRFVAVLTERLAAHQPATVLLIDIDDFKMVNDTMGPALGDQLLYQVAQRLRGTSAARELSARTAGSAGDEFAVLSARLGGDEFAVLLDVEEVTSAEEAAARILQALAEPFRVGEHQLLAHASLGVAIAGPGDSADEVLRNADIAMYAAKEGGKAAWTRFEPRMRQDVVNHARLGSELHNAIIRHELFLLYQPVFDIVTGRLHGAEALVRWKHPTRGFVSPGDFIPVAERSGLIVPLGSWVLREACEQLARWHREHGDGAIKAINVNVAVRQLRESGFVDEVAAVLSETGLLPQNLVLEVTESSVADGRQVRETLHALHEMGVRLALDDFGTGSSSLSLLRAFPVDVLKLDKSFVDGITEGEDRGRLAVAAAVAQLAEYLQLSAVAEGIESEAQLVRLREMGYRLGQGFFMSKPLPAEEAGALMSTPAPVVA